MGVSNIITFDAHDPRVQNAFLWTALITLADIPVPESTGRVPDFKLDNDHLMIISPDEGAMHEPCTSPTSLVSIWVCSTNAVTTLHVVNGKNPIVAMNSSVIP